MKITHKNIYRCNQCNITDKVQSTDYDFQRSSTEKVKYNYFLMICPLCKHTTVEKENPDGDTTLEKVNA